MKVSCVTGHERAGSVFFQSNVHILSTDNILMWISEVYLVFITKSVFVYEDLEVSFISKTRVEDIHLDFTTKRSLLRLLIISSPIWSISLTF
jgi:hypothetical protein